MPKKKDPQLPSEDVCNLRLAIAECARTKAVAECAAWAEKGQAMAAELDRLKRAEAAAAAAKEAKLRAAQAELAHHHAQEEQRLLAQRIGERYDVDWKQTAFDPTTGLLMPINQE